MTEDKPVVSLEAEGVCFGYGGGALTLKGIGVTIEQGDIIGIIGPNGSGKTTFIKCLNRILSPSQGRIALGGEDISELARRDIARTIGYVPQSSGDPISAPTVYEAVMMGRRPRTGWHPTDEDEDVVWSIMEELDVAHLASRPFDRLSSGQTQRVLMARAIAQEARVFLLDEPTSNLDVRYQLDVMDLVADIVRGRGAAACAIIHDLDLALRYCNKLLMMKDGEVYASGPADEVMTAENVREVYGVDVAIEDLLGRRRVIVLRDRILENSPRDVHGIRACPGICLISSSDRAVRTRRRRSLERGSAVGGVRPDCDPEEYT